MGAQIADKENQSVQSMLGEALSKDELVKKKAMLQKDQATLQSEERALDGRKNDVQTRAEHLVSVQQKLEHDRSTLRQGLSNMEVHRETRLASSSSAHARENQESEKRFQEDLARAVQNYEDEEKHLLELAPGYGEAKGPFSIFKDEMKEKIVAHKSGGNHLHATITRRAREAPTSLDSLLDMLKQWFSTYEGDCWQSYQSKEEGLFWRHIRQVSPYRPADAHEAAGVTAAWSTVMTEVKAWVESGSADHISDSKPSFCLEDVPTEVSHLQGLQVAMKSINLREEAQAALLRKLEGNLQLWLRQRLAARLVESYRKAFPKCKHRMVADFSGSLEAPKVVGFEVLPQVDVPDLAIPDVKSLRQGIITKCRDALREAEEACGNAQPLQLENALGSKGSLMERRLGQGPGRVLRESFMASLEVEYARPKAAEKLAKAALSKPEWRLRLKEVFHKDCLLVKRSLCFSVYVCVYVAFLLRPNQEAAHLHAQTAKQWEDIQKVISVRCIPDDAAGHAFRALQATYAAGMMRRRDAVALLASQPGERPHLAASNPFLQAGEQSTGTRPRWTLESTSKVPEKLLCHLKGIVQLQGLSTLLDGIRRELENDHVGATLQRQLADVLQPPQLITDRGDWLQLEWEQGFVCRPVQLEVATAMMDKSFDKHVLQLNMGEGKSKVILCRPQM